jgi:hypothetical protein
MIAEMITNSISGASVDVGTIGGGILLVFIGIFAGRAMERPVRRRDRRAYYKDPVIYDRKSGQYISREESRASRNGGQRIARDNAARERGKQFAKNLMGQKSAPAKSKRPSKIYPTNGVNAYAAYNANRGQKSPYSGDLFSSESYAHNQRSSRVKNGMSERDNPGKFKSHSGYTPREKAEFKLK